MKISHAFEFILLAVIWGASFLLMRIAVPEFGPFALMELRVAIAAIALIPILIIHQKHKELWQHRKPIFNVGIINSAIPFVLFGYATLYLTAGYTAIINATAPLWTAIIAYFWFRQLLSRSALSGLLIGFVGVTALVWDKLSSLSNNITLAIFAALGATFLYGVTVNYTKVNLAQVNPSAIATGSQISAAIVLMPLAFIYWPTQPISLQAWISVISLGVICTAFAYILYFRLLRNIGGAKAVTVAYFIPVFASLFGVYFLHEPISISMITGGSLIILGTALTMGIISPLKKIHKRAKSTAKKI
ncbi:DMT family transporter [Flocculibacter collagenilyticus]|uniref:DMT family transporter n=1 Tax=Flocculibacter collagenilyticus TaxID=2744479 RepID=UPI0018F580C5|nr:DMT family transporter [Flocculibacter collagenilyticus]